jgi:hypothetical protein
MAQKRRDKPLPRGGMQADKTTVALDKLNPAHNFATGHGCIVRLMRVTAGEENLVGNLDDSVRREAPIAPKKNDFSGLEFLRLAPLHRNEIAGADHRQHARPGDFQLHPSLTACNIGNEIATH